MLGYLLSMFAGLFFYTIFQNIKGKSTQALLGDLDIKKSLNAIDSAISKDSGLEQAQTQIRSNMEKTLQQSEKTDDSLETIKNDIDSIISPK